MLMSSIMNPRLTSIVTRGKPGTGINSIAAPRCGKMREECLYVHEWVGKKTQINYIYFSRLGPMYEYRAKFYALENYLEEL
jgi:hypothetical protein